jgi:hypothetical protein
VILVLGVAAGCAPSAAGAEQPQETPPKPIEVSVVVDEQDGVFVGRTVPVRVVVRNTTAGPLMVLDWEKLPSLRDDMVPLRVTIWDYPGQNRPRGGRGTTAGFFGSTWTKDHYRALPPGETVIERSFVPMLPGRARIRGDFCNSHNIFYTFPENRTREKEVKWENAWVGRAFDTTDVSVADRQSAEDQERYDGYRLTLQDPATSADEKLKILAEVAGEKHYFAARFIRETYDAAEPGRVKEAALRHLVDLAMFGTAYESFPLLVKVMEQDDAPQNIRLTLLEWIGKVLARGYQELAEQAFHRYPEPLQEEARQAIGRLAQGRNPLVAAKAQEVLKRLEAKK